jgi:hypothetical protein
MKRFILGILSLTLVVGLGGCKQNQLNAANAKKKFNANNKGIMFSAGNPYHIPYNSNVIIVDLKYEKIFRESGLLKNCNIGDLIWRSPEFMRRANTKPPSLTGYEESQFLVGCAKVMSDNEFQFYSKKENQNRQFNQQQALQNQKLKNDRNIQNQKSLDKSFDRLNNQLNHMTPTQHNINVYHY